MADEYYQCCYTNDEVDVGGVISSGWQTVAESENLPVDVRRTCVAWQGNNSTIQHAMLDERGDVLNLYEVFGDQSYLYTMHTKYGLTDRLGRANMFSHALVFPWEQSGALADPRVFLAVDDACYKQSKAEAQQQQALERSESLGLALAMRELGMGRAAYAKLMSCVYAKLTDAALADPLFVAFDGTTRQMRITLLCIYSGLPYGLRRRLSAASTVANNASQTALIFSVRAAEHACFVDPRTGKNNLLNEHLAARLEGLGFVTYAPARLNEGNIGAYFFELDQLARELGDTTGADQLVLRIAHAMLVAPDVGVLSDDGLLAQLDDALRARPLGNSRMDERVAELVEELMSRDIALSQVHEGQLAARLEVTQNEHLMNVVAAQQVAGFAQRTPEEIVAQLAQLGPYMRKLELPHLLESEVGLAALDRYYADVVLAEEPPTWDTWHQVLNDTERLPNRIHTLRRIDSLANERYRMALADLKAVVPEYRQYVALMQRMMSSANAQKRAELARAAYWVNTRFESYDMDAADDHRAMADGSDRMRMFTAFSGIPGIWRTTNSILRLFEGVRDFFVAYGDVLDAEGARTVATDKLCMSVQKNYGAYDILAGGWVRAATSLASDAELNLLKNARDDLYNNRFEDCINDFVWLRDICAKKDDVAARAAVRQVAELIRQCAAAKLEADSTLVIPLDLWLLVGVTLYENPFEVFDRTPSAAAMCADPDELVKQSRLCHRTEYQSAGEQYVLAGGSAARLVRDWLAIAGHIVYLDGEVAPQSKRSLWPFGRKRKR